MRLIFGLVLVLGLGIAGFAVYMAKTYIGAYQTELAKARQNSQPAVPTEEVYVANRPLRYGEALTQDAVRTVEWPRNAIPEGTFTSAKDLFAEDDRPRVVLRAMEKDEAIMQVKVTAPGEDAGLTSRLQRGMRAFTIKVDVASGVSGFLRPGDRVDIYWTGRMASSGGDLTKLIEPGMQLVAVDQTADSDTTGTNVARTVTVAATPQQVAGLAQAQSTGDLTLSLVGSQDDTIAEAIEVDQRSLLGIREQAPAPEPKAEKEEVCTIRTRRGSDVVEIPIPCTN